MKKYEKIMMDLLDAMQKGTIKRGDKLPSLRQLQHHYQCSIHTVQKAMEELRRNQYIYPLEKSGFYALYDLNKQEAASSFKDSMPDYRQFPFLDFQTCLNQSFSKPEEDFFHYSSLHQGLPRLIDSLHGQFERQAIYTKKEQMIITSGSQQALYILCQLAGKRSHAQFLVEQPTYHRMNELIQQLNLPYQTIERTHKGIDLDQLEHLFKQGNLHYFYTIPRFHNPLGTHFMEQEKKELVRLAEQYGVYIIEDDYMADFDQSFHLPLHYYDTNERVIYLKSFSSSIFPALRMNAMVIPKDLLTDFLTYKQLIDYDSNLVMQKALSLYIDNGMYDAHLKRLRNIFVERNQVLMNALASYAFEDCLDTKIALSLNSKVSIANLKRLCSPYPFIDFFETSYIDTCPYHYLGINISRMPLEDINPCIESLLTLLHPYLQNKDLSL